MKYEVTIKVGNKHCELCECQLPDDWPYTTIQIKVSTDSVEGHITKLWCEPCKRRVTQ